MISWGAARGGPQKHGGRGRGDLGSPRAAAAGRRLGQAARAIPAPLLLPLPLLQQQHQRLWRPARHSGKFSDIGGAESRLLRAAGSPLRHHHPPVTAPISRGFAAPGPCLIRFYVSGWGARGRSPPSCSAAEISCGPTCSAFWESSAGDEADKLARLRRRGRT